MLEGKEGLRTESTGSQAQDSQPWISYLLLSRSSLVGRHGISSDTRDLKGEPTIPPEEPRIWVRGGKEQIGNDSSGKGRTEAPGKSCGGCNMGSTQMGLSILKCRLKSRESPYDWRANESRKCSRQRHTGKIPEREAEGCPGSTWAQRRRKEMPWTLPTLRSLWVIPQHTTWNSDNTTSSGVGGGEDT